MGTAKQLVIDGIDLTKKVAEKGGDTVVEYMHGMIGTANDIGQTVPEFIAGVGNFIYNVGNTIAGWFFCPVDVEFYTKDGTYLAGIHGETVDYGEAFDDTIIIWNDGDKKYFAINTNQEIQIKLIGTDEGTMDCFIDTIPQGVFLSDSYVYYDAVPLVDGKVMTLTINESTAEYANKMSVYDENNNVSEIINPDIDVETSFYGDANGDYDFTIADAVLLSRIVAEDDVEVPDYGWRNADVNGDSIIDMNDVMALLNILSIGA